jgi:DNA gyrase/topoisomerase IV subunit A
MDPLDIERQRREIVAATLFAAEHAEQVLAVCADVDGDEDAAAAAIAAAFGVNDIQARAILQMQLRRFTPHAIEQIRSELADIDGRLSV